jgi:putative toxin-antitoxin system antitoxin component (TIGR02293 family)
MDTTSSIKFKKKIGQEIASILKHKSYEGESNPDGLENLTYSDFLADKMLMIRVIQQGVPASLFLMIQQNTPFNTKDWAEILNISTKSLTRYIQESKKFKTTQSERIIEMAEVTALGTEVFGNMEKFRLWLDTPDFALGNHTPMELLRDSYGKELVMGELTRINYGILA